MTTHYFTILMNHLENMQVEVTATAESFLDADADPAQQVLKVYDCNRILLVTSGEGTLTTDLGLEPVSSGICSIVLAGQPHTLVAKDGGKLSYIWCHFRASYADRELYKLLGLPQTVRMNSMDESLALFQRLQHWTLLEARTSRLRAKAALLDLISLYIEQVRSEFFEVTLPSPEMDKIETVLRYVDEHLSDSITVEELAKLVYLHPNYFIVFFKGMMGCSPIQYVNQRRLEIARKLLAEPGCNVTDVASRIGMKIYYFSRLFKSHTGLTPSKFRKLALQGNFAGLESEEASQQDGQRSYADDSSRDRTVKLPADAVQERGEN